MSSRAAAAIVAVLIGVGSAYAQEVSRHIVPPLRPHEFGPPLSRKSPPVPATTALKLAELKRWFPHGGSLGAPVTISPDQPNLVLAANSLATLDFFGADWVHTYAWDHVAIFQAKAASGFVPYVEITVQGSPTEDLFFDCSISPDATGSFQFQETDQYGSWQGASTVTPTADHVFYGIGPIPLDPINGVPTWRGVRLMSSSGNSSGWDFFGCELSLAS
jgi:hypothetical protein